MNLTSQTVIEDLINDCPAVQSLSRRHRRSPPVLNKHGLIVAVLCLGRVVCPEVYCSCTAGQKVVERIRLSPIHRLHILDSSTHGTGEGGVQKYYSHFKGITLIWSSDPPPSLHSTCTQW